jgi:hypothetical protein
MTPCISKLVLAAVLASTLPAAAIANDCGHDVRVDRHERSSAVPAHGPAPRWREAAWRDRELRELRAELQSLDAQRTYYHARYFRNPGKLRRYDRWYADRRAELERRWHELERFAMR